MGSTFQGIAHPSSRLHALCGVDRLRHLEYFHDHVRVEAMLFDGVLEPVDGALVPDRSRSGHGLRTQTCRCAAVGGVIARLFANIRDGRVQKLLAATTALSAPALGVEIYFEHYKGSFGDKWMWTPLVLTPPLNGRGDCGLREREGCTHRAARGICALLPRRTRSA